MIPSIARIAVLVGLALPALAQSGTLNTYAGLNTVQYKVKSTATPDPTIAVGLKQYCEHVNSGYQCWDKTTNLPVKFLGNTNAKLDSQPWTQNANNSGNTANCGTSYSPNSQLLHDSVYNVWILEKRISSTLNSHNYLCVAITNVEDFTQTARPAFQWFGYEYDLDLVIPQNTLGHFLYPDYPQAGLWQSSTSTIPPYTAATDQALWISYDLLDSDNHNIIQAPLLCAVDIAGLRASMASPWTNRSRTPACVVAHPRTQYIQRRSYAPAHNTDSAPPLAADGEMFTYMIEPPQDNVSYLTDPNHTEGVEQWTINWSAPQPAPSQLAGWDLPSTQLGGDQLGCFNRANYYNTACVPQPSTGGTRVVIDPVADRVQPPFQYTSNGGTTSSWITSHTIQISPNPVSLSRTEVILRKLQRNAGGAVQIAVEYPLTDPLDAGNWAFLATAVQDKAGNLQGIFGVSGPGASEHPGMQSFFVPAATQSLGTYGYVISPATAGDAKGTDAANYRWGDWYSATVDLSDGCTVWTVGEYLPSNRTTTPYWYTQIAKLPPVSGCGTAK